MAKIQTRYLKKPVKEDLKNKMVFVGGPRQVGKTTFALTFLPESSEKHPAYLNWDDISVSQALFHPLKIPSRLMGA
jgi:predicted AAA+ superfamily ATPase